MEASDSRRIGNMEVERLVLAARHHLKSAREKIESGNQLAIQERHALQEVAIHAGIAVELLSKAVLASVDVMLLSGSPDVIYHELLSRLLGPEDRIALGASPNLGTKTITATTALSYACRIRPSIGPTSAVEAALRYRNAAAHAAECADRPKIEAALIDAESFQFKVLQELREVTGDIVGELEYAEWEVCASKRMDELAAATMQSIETARAGYQRLVNGLTSEQTENLGRMLASRFVSVDSQDGSDIRHERCPACDYDEGILTSHYDPDDLDGAIPSGFFIPSKFECPRCGLRLDSSELVPAGIDTGLFTSRGVVGS